MALGTKGFQVVKGDLVKVVAGGRVAIPRGTIAPVCGVCSGKEEKYRLAGYRHVYVRASDLELVSYVRNK